jgi:hypothetical protein
MRHAHSWLTVGALVALVALVRARPSGAQRMDGGAVDASLVTDAALDARMDDASQVPTDVALPTVTVAQCPVARRDPDVVSLDGTPVRLVVSRETSVECSEDLRECRGSFSVRVDNCGPGVVRLRRATLFGSGVTGQGSSSLIVSTGESRTMTMAFFGAGISSLELNCEVVLDSGAVSYMRRTIVVNNPARVRALAACRACRGDWGRHGMLGMEGCICRTRDGGRRCTDGRDCEGMCLVTGTEIVRRPPPCRETRGRICPLASTLVRAVGRCSEFVFAFGCHSYIPAGERDRPLGSTVSMHRVCAD